MIGGPEDNTPDDVTFVGPKGWTAYTSAGTSVSFDCTPDKGCELPDF